MRLFAMLLFLGATVAQGAETPGVRSVTAFGAVGDGVVDDTAAFQAAMDAAAGDGGGVVTVPAGRFRIDGNLVIRERVALEGVWRAPHRGQPFDSGGTVLLAFAGKGGMDGPPFIRLSTSSTLKGVTIFYPEQIRANPPLPYPWTVAGEFTDNATILDVTMVNPYMAVDLGSKPNGRHYIRNLHGYPLFKGLYINECYDVGRIENIHFWPYWDQDPGSPLWAFTRENATAFILGKTDGEMGYGLFSIFYKIGMHFIAGPILDKDGAVRDHLAGSGTYTNCYMDVSPCAVLVDAAMPEAGISFVNSSFMARVVVGPKNRGPVKFTGCGFWGTNELASHAELEGRGTVLFSACHFSGWDRGGTGAPCIQGNNRRLLVTGCDFNTSRSDHNILSLGPRVRSAVITSNTMPGGERIINKATAAADIQIANNAVEARANFVSEWVVLAGFPNPELASPTPGAPRHAGFEMDYLAVLGGEAAARLTGKSEVEFSDATGASFVAKARVLRTEDTLNFHELDPATFRTAYAFTWIESDRDQTALLEFGTNDSAKVWVNGELIHALYLPTGAQCVPGAESYDVPLKQGRNPLLFKVIDQGGSAWELVCEVYGENGEGLTATIEP